jgi:hypothetical protein
MVFNEACEPVGGEAAVPRLPDLSSLVILKNLWYEIERLKLPPSDVPGLHSSDLSH